MPYRIATFALAVLAALPAAAQTTGLGSVEVNDAEIEVTGIGQHRAFACERRKLIVSGSDHVITTTGECRSVEVSGIHNVVEVALGAKSQLEVSGSGNTLRWRAPDNPSQSISGIDHKIQRLK